MQGGQHGGHRPTREYACTDGDRGFGKCLSTTLSTLQSSSSLSSLGKINFKSFHQKYGPHSALRGGVISRFHKRGSRMHLGDPFGSLKDRSTNITPHFGILGLPGPKNGQKRPKSGQKQGKAKLWASDGPKWLDQCRSKVDLVLGHPN